MILNGVARIYVGAHNPLDVIGGIGLGVFIGGLLNMVLAPQAPGPPARASEKPAPAPAEAALVSRGRAGTAGSLAGG